MEALATSGSRRPLAARIAVTLLSVMLALGLSLLLREQIAQTVFIFFWVAVIAAASYAGFWAAVFVIVAAVALVNFFLLEPRGTFDPGAPANIISIGIFVGLALFVSWLAERMRAAEQQALLRARQLEDQAIELETQMEVNQTVTMELETTLKETEQARGAAETASRAKSEFLAVMSHELRTPLNAIVGYTDLLQSGVVGPLTPTQSMHLSRIRSSSWHLLDLIQDVLSFSRLEAGRETLRLSDVDTTTLVFDVISYIEPEATGKGLRVEADLPVDPIVMVTDPGKLRQILLNLLSNAVKFTDVGELGVRVRKDSKGVEFHVWDTGRGIAAHNHDSVFEPFTQVDQSMTRVHGGAGLGLPVTKQLVELLGGSLALHSELGKGTTFSMSFPVQVR